MKFNQIAFALVTTLGLVTAANAGIDGGSSNTANIAIGTAEAGGTAPSDHVGGTAALSVASATSPWNMYIGFSALKGLASAYTSLGTSNTNVTVPVSSTENLYLNVSSIPVSAMPASHSALGNFNFAQVLESSGNQGSLPEVFFGEWWGSSDTVDGSTRTVYYAGDNTNTTVPTSGTAVYSVAGINNGVSLVGTFDVNFNDNGVGTLSGTLTGSSTVTSLSVDAGFDVGDSAFAGSATAVGTLGTDASGEVEGYFYGANAAALAGIASFNTTAYNTAFGGVKQ
ncbi:Slam-dependent surface lipoprotein [Acinetobacter populi]|uniref:Uncharacterized protein n=1 Tax=Acinetobacter populi TaxID=1582270 RepID=A0A1Z9YWA8_9GAMM|nr:Slam-dependent surface lipoprotein [Acinetobacter populi]OUY06505.1 hypothetical protein CAP51_11235 [Acinetobacter populi]